MITAQLTEGLTATLQIGKHTLVSGVKESLGGKDEGPDPHELLEAALVACTIITVQMYAARKQWPVEQIDVTVKITSETKEGTHIKRQVSFIGDLSDEQRQRLREIADRCPIHRLLSGPISIETEMV